MKEQQLLFLRLGNEKGKFAIPLLASPTDLEAAAMEDLMIRGLIRLIDVSPIVMDEAGSIGIARIFLLSEDAKAIVARANSN